MTLAVRQDVLEASRKTCVDDRVVTQAIEIDEGRVGIGTMIRQSRDELSCIRHHVKSDFTMNRG